MEIGPLMQKFATTVERAALCDETEGTAKKDSRIKKCRAEIASRIVVFHTDSHRHPLIPAKAGKSNTRSATANRAWVVIAPGQKPVASLVWIISENHHENPSRMRMRDPCLRSGNGTTGRE